MNSLGEMSQFSPSLIIWMDIFYIKIYNEFCILQFYNFLLNKYVYVDVYVYVHTRVYICDTFICSFVYRDLFISHRVFVISLVD